MSKAAAIWKKRVANWRASGETASRFGARNGLAANTLRWWSSRLRREESGRASATGVRLVRVVASVPERGAVTGGGGGAIRVDWGRARIVVEPGFDRDTLAAVLDVLERRDRR